MTDFEKGKLSVKLELLVELTPRVANCIETIRVLNMLENPPQDLKAACYSEGMTLIKIIKLIVNK